MTYPLGRGEEKRGCKDICSVWVRCPPSQATHLIYTCLSSHLTKLSRTSADERVLAARKEERKLPLIFWCETLLTLLSVGTPPAGKSRSDTDRVSGWKLTPIDESLLSPCSQILNPPVAVADRVTTIRTTFKSPSLARGRPHRQADFGSSPRSPPTPRPDDCLVGARMQLSGAATPQSATDRSLLQTVPECETPYRVKPDSRKRIKRRACHSLLTGNLLFSR